MQNAEWLYPILHVCSDLEHCHPWSPQSGLGTKKEKKILYHFWDCAIKNSWRRNKIEKRPCHHLPLPRLTEPSPNWGHHTLWSWCVRWSRSDPPYNNDTLLDIEKQSYTHGSWTFVYERKYPNSEDTLFHTKRKEITPALLSWI